MASQVDGCEETSIQSQPGCSKAGPKRKRQLKLTPSQRERKRAIDREAQRSIRTKTKNYIAHLESLVKVLEDNDSAPNNGVEGSGTRELMSQLRQSQDEVRKLRHTVAGIQKMIGGAMDESISMGEETMLPDRSISLPSFSRASAVQSQSPGSSNSASDSDYKSSTAVDFDRKTPDAIPRSSYTQGEMHMMRYPGAQVTSTMAVKDGSADSQLLLSPPSSGLGYRQYEGEWLYSVEAEINRVVSGGPSVKANELFDEDIIVRAALEGWSAVEYHYSMDEAWQAIKKIDEANLFGCGVLEKMAILRGVRMKLMQQTFGTTSTANGVLPAYWNHELSGSRVVEHFAWPGLRALVYLRPEKYITNAFLEAFRRHFKFLWSGEVSEAYTRDPVTQLYSCSPEFVQRWYDLRCWTMRRDMFEFAEELFDAIPAYEGYIPRYWPSPETSTVPSSKIGKNAVLHKVGEEEREKSSSMIQCNTIVPSSLSQEPATQSWLADGNISQGLWQETVSLSHAYPYLGMANVASGYLVYSQMGNVAEMDC